MGGLLGQPVADDMYGRLRRNRVTAFTLPQQASVLEEETLLSLDRLARRALHAPSVASPKDVQRVARRARHRHPPTVYSWEELTDRFHHIRAMGRSDRAICFRHGMTKYNQRNLISGQHDTLLTDAGAVQARAIARELPQHLDLIVCSALTRTIQTMVLGVPRSMLEMTPVIVDPRLNEVNLGQLQGRRREFVAAFSQGDLDFAPLGGESYRAAAQRVLSSVCDIFLTLGNMGGPPKGAALFVHAGVLRILSSLASSNKDGTAVFHLDVRNAESVTLTSQTLRLSPVWSKNDKHVDPQSYRPNSRVGR